MAKKLIVKTDVGTFTRSTARHYTHIVVAEGVRFEVLEAERLAALKYARKQLREYEAILAGDKTIGIRTTSAIARDWDIEWRDKSLADGSYLKYAADARADVARLEAQGPVTVDAGVGFGLLGWTSRLDLALKLASASGTSLYASAGRFRNVRVYALDGTRVR